MKKNEALRKLDDLLGKKRQVVETQSDAVQYLSQMLAAEEEFSEMVGRLKAEAEVQGLKYEQFGDCIMIMPPKNQELEDYEQSIEDLERNLRETMAYPPIVVRDD